MIKSNIWPVVQLAVRLAVWPAAVMVVVMVQMSQYQTDPLPRQSGIPPGIRTNPWKISVY